MQDHREVERLFGPMKAEPEQRPMLAPVVAALLVAHRRAQEADVYPAARDEAGTAHEVEHSQEEHAGSRLLERLASPDTSQTSSSRRSS
jgi:hypothetical protein